MGGALFLGAGPLSPSLAIDAGLALVLLPDPCPLPDGTSAHSKKSHCSSRGLGQVWNGLPWFWPWCTVFLQYSVTFYLHSSNTNNTYCTACNPHRQVKPPLPTPEEPRPLPLKDEIDTQ